MDLNNLTPEQQQQVVQLLHQIQGQNPTANATEQITSAMQVLHIREYCMFFNVNFSSATTSFDDARWKYQDLSGAQTAECARATTTK